MHWKQVPLCHVVHSSQEPGTCGLCQRPPWKRQLLPPAWLISRAASAQHAVGSSGQAAASLMEAACPQLSSPHPNPCTQSRPLGTRSLHPGLTPRSLHPGARQTRGQAWLVEESAPQSSKHPRSTVNPPQALVMAWSFTDGKASLASAERSHGRAGASGAATTNGLTWVPPSSARLQGLSQQLMLSRPLCKAKYLAPRGLPWASLGAGQDEKSPAQSSLGQPVPRALPILQGSPPPLRQRQSSWGSPRQSERSDRCVPDGGSLQVLWSAFPASTKHATNQAAPARCPQQLWCKAGCHRTMQTRANEARSVLPAVRYASRAPRPAPTAPEQAWTEPRCSKHHGPEDGQARGHSAAIPRYRRPRGSRCKAGAGTPPATAPSAGPGRAASCPLQQCSSSTSPGLSREHARLRAFAEPRPTAQLSQRSCEDARRGPEQSSRARADVPRPEAPCRGGAQKA